MIRCPENFPWSSEANGAAMPSDRIQADEIFAQTDKHGPGQTANEQQNSKPCENTDRFQGQKFDPALVGAGGLFEFRKVGFKAVNVSPMAEFRQTTLTSG